MEEVNAYKMNIDKLNKKLLETEFAMKARAWSVVDFEGP